MKAFGLEALKIVDINAKGMGVGKDDGRVFFAPGTVPGDVVDIETGRKRKAYYEANKEKVKASNKAYREANKEKAIAYAKAYRKANKEKLSSNNKKYYLKVKYGITLKEKNFILKKQNNKCKICKITIHKNKKLKNNTACIDHCHTTNKLRGILCSMCNKGLGHFKDNTEILTNAIDYLKEAETLPEEFKQ